jgi:site-specific DNA recombinase
MGQTQRRKLTPIRETTRAVAYVRVSSEEQVEGYSLAAQERAVRAYCEAHGWELVDIYADEGRSAWTQDLSKRPGFGRMLQDAETGAFDVLIVHKLDRFARNVMVALETLHELEAHNVGFVSLSESMDFTTPIGKVILTTLASFAEYYSANLSAETKKGKAERKRQGMYNGVVPFGMRKGDDGVPVGCPETLPGLHLAFERAAAGDTDREVAQALNAAGYRTTGNRGRNPFTKDTVRPMLQNRFYLGELPTDDGWIPGKHEPVIDVTLFDAAQRARARNLKRFPQTGMTHRSPWALSGVATCACGASMIVNGGGNGKRRIRCANRIQGGDCAEPSVMLDLLEAQLSDYLPSFAIPESDRAALVDEWLKQQRTHSGSAKERTRLESKAERLKALYLEGDLSDADYRKERTAVNAALAELPPDDALATKRTGNRLAELLADLALAWSLATPDERNRIARELFLEVVVHNKTAVAVKPRPEMLPFFRMITRNFEGAPEEMEQGRKRRGSVERDRLRAATADSHSLPGKRTCVTPATRSRPVRSGGETMPHPKGALARSGRAIELRGPSQYRP